MKKLSVILAIFVALTFIGCASSGGGGGGDSGAAPYSVDLGTVKVSNWDYGTKKFGDLTPGVKNVEPFNRQYSGVIVQFVDIPNVVSYPRLTVKVKYFNAEGEEIPQGDGNAMIVMFIDINGNLEGPEMGAGPNTPLKEFNLGGFSGTVHTDKGSRIFLKQNPGGLLLQCSRDSVKFIEVQEITFHS